MATAVYTLPEVATHLRVKARTVRRLISKGEIETIRVGRLRRVTDAQLERYLRRCETGDTTARTAAPASPEEPRRTLELPETRVDFEQHVKTRLTGTSTPPDSSTGSSPETRRSTSSRRREPSSGGGSTSSGSAA